MFFLKWKHSSLEAHLKQLLFLREEINKYYIFSCIRNPWDRAVSWYYHHKAIAGLGNGNSIGRFSFEKFIFTSFYYIKAGAPNPLTTRPFTNSSTRKPDFIIRYENYSEDLHYITKKFNLNDSKIIPYNSQERFKKTSYREYYPNDELVSIVQELAKDSIEDFGYKF